MKNKLLIAPLALSLACTVSESKTPPLPETKVSIMEIFDGAIQVRRDSMGNIFQHSGGVPDGTLTKEEVIGSFTHGHVEQDLEDARKVGANLVAEQNISLINTQVHRATAKAIWDQILEKLDKNSDGIINKHD